MSIFRDNREVVAASITGICSIIGSLFVAYIVSHYSAIATIDAVLLANENSQNISNEKLKLQRQQLELTNKNQIDAIHLTAQKNIDALREAAKIDREVLRVTYLNQKKLQIEKEKREIQKMQQRSSYFMMADIEIQVTLLEGSLYSLDNILRTIKESKMGDAKKTFYMKHKLLSGIADSPIHNNILLTDDSLLKHLSNIDSITITRITLPFYWMLQTAKAQDLTNNGSSDSSVLLSLTPIIIEV
ncbi:MAG: hypothetical protein ACI8PB_002145 [Desulforhopalus sp.]|jgi:hypothetical protein